VSLKRRGRLTPLPQGARKIVGGNLHTKGVAQNSNLRNIVLSATGAGGGLCKGVQGNTAGHGRRQSVQKDVSGSGRGRVA